VGANAGLTGDFRGKGQKLGSLDYAEGETMMADSAAISRYNGKRYAF
jgi:hypothetical protein